MKILCLGNNSVDTDTQTTKLATSVNSINHGLITEIIDPLDGYYHTSILDMSFTDILELSLKFNKVIVLDQPKDQWPHDNAFYNTVRVATKISQKIPVEWQNTEANKNINYFKNLVETNKSFCIYPFIELLAMHGETTLCCRSEKPITKLDQITDFSTDKNYQVIRDKMIKGEKLSSYCSRCYDYEKLGMISHRQQETVEWANRLNLSSIEDVKKIKAPTYYEVWPSNVCNLQCRMCSPKWSNQLEKEWKQIGLLTSDTAYEYHNFSFVNLDSVKKLYIAGGEPTAMPELYDFFDSCIEKKKTDFEIVINTNAVKISNKLKAKFNQFSNLEFIVSIDGFKDVNHYVRWPSEWNQIIDNVKDLKQNGHYVSFNITVSIYTVGCLYNLLEFLDNEFPNSTIHGAIVRSKEGILSPFNHPDPGLIKNSLVKCVDLNCYKNDPLLESFIDGLINYYNNPNPVNYSKLNKFFDFNDKLDKSRNIRLKDYLPDIDKHRQECYNKL